MRKNLLKVFFFIIIFLFLNLNNNETENIIPIDYYNEELNDQKYFALKTNNFNIYDLTLLENYDLQIISITPKDTHNIKNVKFNNSNIEKIINDSIYYYENKLMNDNNYDDAVSIKNKGFIIDKISILSTYEELMKLENKIDFKVLKKALN